MIRKILAALLVGAAVVALNRPDEAAEAVEGLVRDGTDAARDAIVERCRDDPASCVR